MGSSDSQVGSGSLGSSSSLKAFKDLTQIVEDYNLEQLAQRHSDVQARVETKKREVLIIRKAIESARSALASLTGLFRDNNSIKAAKESHEYKKLKDRIEATELAYNDKEIEYNEVVEELRKAEAAYLIKKAHLELDNVVSEGS